MVNSKRLVAPAQDRRTLRRHMEETLEEVPRAGAQLHGLLELAEAEGGGSSSDNEEVLLQPEVDMRMPVESESDSGDELVEMAVHAVIEKSVACGAAVGSLSAYMEACEVQSQSAHIETNTRFATEDVNQASFRDVFRWHCAEDVETLARALNMPETFVLPNRGRVPATTALLTTLARLSHSGPLASVKNYIPIVPIRISFTVTAVLEFLSETYWKKLFNRCMALSARFPLYYEAISDKTGVPGLPCIGFIDGTGRETARCGNSALQNANYNGYYGGDVLKWHGVQAPDGLWLHAWGPLEGSANDINLIDESEFEDKMQEVEMLLGRHYCVYGDETYRRTRYVQGGFRRGAGERQEGTTEDRYSRVMNAARTSSEWGYQGITTLFPMISNLQTQKILQCPVALHYRGAVLLYNCYQCMYGTSVTGTYFDCPAPDVDTYLRGGFFAHPSAYAG